MQPERSAQRIDEVVYSREFAGSPHKYLIASILSCLYLGVSIYLIYALFRFYFAGDASVFSLKALLYVGIFCGIYIPWSYKTIIKYDGIRSSGRGWVEKEASVKLIEKKRHRRFG